MAMLRWAALGLGYGRPKILMPTVWVMRLPQSMRC